VAAAVFGKKTPSVRTLGNYNATPQHVVVRAGLTVNSLADLKGKRLEMLAAGDGVEVVSKKMLEAVGIAWSEVKSEYSGNRVQAASRLKTGQVDAIIDGTGIGGAWMTDLVGDGSRFKFLGLTDGEIQKITGAYPEFAPMTIPAGSYKGQPQALKTVGNWTVMVVRGDLSDGLVYQLTKHILENQPFLKDRHKYFADLRAENIVNAVIAPLHPGAERYYKEKNILK
jgi:hypothetical protein